MAFHSKLASFVFCFLCFCFYSNSYAQIPDQLFENCDAIVIEQSIDVLHSTKGKFNLTYFQSVQILSAGGNDFQEIIIPYKEGTQKISKINIRVYDGDGKLIKDVKQREIEDYSSTDGYSMVSDHRVKHWKSDESNYPIIVEYSYEMESNTTLLLPFWDPIPGYNVSVVQSSYKLMTNREVRSQELNLDQFESINKTGEFSYEMRHQPAIKAEPFSPMSMSTLPMVILHPNEFSFEQQYGGSFTDYKELGNWMYDRFLDKKELKDPEGVKSQLDSFIDQTNSKREIAKKIYQYVQNNTRYVSIGLDEGGLNPLSPAKVHNVKYGDCKALSLYTMKLLELYQIPSNYVVVSAGQDQPRSFMNDFASTYPGNHIIVNIPFQEDTVWVDCTSNHSPFNFLGSFTDDRVALEINRDNTRLVRTPSYGLDANRSSDELTLLLEENGDLQMMLQQHNTGLEIERHFRMKDMPPTDLQKHLIEKYLEQLPISDFDHAAYKYDESKAGSTLEVDCHLRQFCEVANEYYFIPLTYSDLQIPYLPKNKDRQNAIDFLRAYNSKSKALLKTKSAAQFAEQPDFELSSEYGNYSIQTRQIDDQTLEVTRSFSLHKGQYKPQEYEKIKDFLDRCLKTERSSITIKKL